MRRVCRTRSVHVQKYLRKPRRVTVAVARITRRATFRNLRPPRRLRVLPHRQIGVRRGAQRLRVQRATRRRRTLIERVEDCHCMQFAFLHARMNVFNGVNPYAGIILHALSAGVHPRAKPRSCNRLGPCEQICCLLLQQPPALLLIEKQNRSSREPFALRGCDCCCGVILSQRCRSGACLLRFQNLCVKPAVCENKKSPSLRT